MALKKGVDVKPASGKLGVLMPGMGAVATTFIAGVKAIRRGLGKPIGSLTQLGHINPVHMGVLIIVSLAFGLITASQGWTFRVEGERLRVEAP